MVIIDQKGRSSVKVGVGRTSFKAISKPEEDSDDIGDNDHPADISRSAIIQRQMYWSELPCENPDESLLQSARLGFIRDHSSSLFLDYAVCLVELVSIRNYQQYDLTWSA